MQIRVVSYNVLSSHLARPDHFTTYNPDHLKAAQRLPLILEKLDEQRATAAAGSSSGSIPTIFCLQEVSRDWAGELHTYFANVNYHFVTGLYGRSFNGYMGVGIAWPMDQFDTMNVDIQRVSDTNTVKNNNNNTTTNTNTSPLPTCPGWPRSPPDETSIFVKLPKRIVSTLVTSWAVPLLEKWNIMKKPNVDPWDYAQWRQNLLVSVELKPKNNNQLLSSSSSSSSSNSFWISNYHMPCAFWAPPVMTMHAELTAHYIQSKLSKQSTIPFILAGDWNIKPQDTIYERLTTGRIMDEQDPAKPQDKYNVPWKCTINPMTSAYASVSSNGKTEPEFTNYARVKEDEPFIDTLDYIFLSHQCTDTTKKMNSNSNLEESAAVTTSNHCDWKVLNVQSLASKENGPFPNLDVKEPSDHVLIAATLELV